MGVGRFASNCQPQRWVLKTRARKGRLEGEGRGIWTKELGVAWKGLNPDIFENKV